MTAFFITLQIFLWFLLLRNLVTYRLKAKALTLVSNKANEAINSDNQSWRKYYAYFDSVSYEQIMFNFFIWKVNHVYPRLLDDSF